MRFRYPWAAAWRVILHCARQEPMHEPASLDARRWPHWPIAIICATCGEAFLGSAQQVTDLRRIVAKGGP